MNMSWTISSKKSQMISRLQTSRTSEFATSFWFWFMIMDPFDDWQAANSSISPWARRLLSGDAFSKDEQTRWGNTELCISGREIVLDPALQDHGKTTYKDFERVFLHGAFASLCSWVCFLCMCLKPFLLRWCDTFQVENRRPSCGATAKVRDLALWSFVCTECIESTEFCRRNEFFQLLYSCNWASMRKNQRLVKDCKGHG